MKTIIGAVVFAVLAGCATFNHPTGPMQQNITVVGSTPPAVLNDLAERLTIKIPDARIKSITSNQLVTAMQDKDSHLVFNPRSGNVEETTGVTVITFNAFAVDSNVTLTITADYLVFAGGPDQITTPTPVPDSVAVAVRSGLTYDKFTVQQSP